MNDNVRTKLQAYANGQNMPKRRSAKRKNSKKVVQEQPKKPETKITEPIENFLDVRVDDILLMDDPHSECRDKHYLDPYTKVEYCLPTEFSNMSMIHLYRVEK